MQAFSLVLKLNYCTALQKPILLNAENINNIGGIYWDTSDTACILQTMATMCSHQNGSVELLQNCKMSGDRIAQLENELTFSRESHKQLIMQLETGYSIIDPHKEEGFCSISDCVSNAADDVSQTSSSWTEILEDPLDDPWRNILSPIRNSPLSQVEACSGRESSQCSLFKSSFVCRLNPSVDPASSGDVKNCLNVSTALYVPRQRGEIETQTGIKLIESSLIERDIRGDRRDSMRSHSRTCTFCSEHRDCAHRYLEKTMDQSSSFLHSMVAELTSALADRTAVSDSLSTANRKLELKISELQSEAQHSHYDVAPSTPGKVSGELFRECSRLRWRIVELEKGFSAEVEKARLKESLEREERETELAVAIAAAAALQQTISYSTEPLNSREGEAGAGVGAAVAFRMTASSRTRGYRLRKSVNDLQSSSLPYDSSPSPCPSTPPFFTTSSPCSPSTSAPVSGSDSVSRLPLLLKIFESEGSRGNSDGKDRERERNKEKDRERVRIQNSAFQDCVRSPTSVSQIVSMIEQEHEGRELKVQVRTEDDRTKCRRAHLREGVMETTEFKHKAAFQVLLEQKEKERRVADEVHYYQIQRLMGKVRELIVIHDNKEEGFRMLIQSLEEQLEAVTYALYIAQDSTYTAKVSGSESESLDIRDLQPSHHRRDAFNNADNLVEGDEVIQEGREAVREEEKEEESEVEAEVGFSHVSAFKVISIPDNEGKSDRRQQQQQMSVVDVKKPVDGDGDRDRDVEGQGNSMKEEANRGEEEHKSAGSADDSHDSLHHDRTSQLSASASASQYHPNGYLSSLLLMDLNKSKSKSESVTPAPHNHSYSHEQINNHSRSNSNTSSVSHTHSQSHSPELYDESGDTSPFTSPRSSSSSSSSSSFPSCLTSPAASSTCVSPAEHHHHHHHPHQEGENDVYDVDEDDKEGGQENVHAHVGWQEGNLDLSAAVDSCHLEPLRKRIVLQRGVQDGWKRELSQ